MSNPPATREPLSFFALIRSSRQNLTLVKLVLESSNEPAPVIPSDDKANYYNIERNWSVSGRRWAGAKTNCGEAHRPPPPTRVRSCHEAVDLGAGHGVAADRDGLHLPGRVRHPHRVSGRRPVGGQRMRGHAGLVLVGLHRRLPRAPRARREQVGIRQDALVRSRGLGAPRVAAPTADEGLHAAHRAAKDRIVTPSRAGRRLYGGRDAIAAHRGSLGDHPGGARP